MCRRIVALLLLFSMIFCISGCSGEGIPRKDKDFTLEAEPAQYTDEQIESFSGEVADTCAKLNSALGFSALKQKERDNIARLFKEKLLGALIDIPVYPDELSEILSCANATVDGASLEGEMLMLELYTSFSAILGTDRIGMLVYEIEKCRIEECLDEELSKNGYYYNQKRVDYYTALSDDATALGKEEFSEAVSVLMFMLCASLGSVSLDDGMIRVEGADLSVILRKQGERFSSLSLTAEEWQTVARMCEEPLGDMPSVQFKNQMLLPLSEDGFFRDTARVMPALLDFYGVITSDIPKESARFIVNGEGYEAASAVCRQIALHEESFMELLGSVESLMPPAGAQSLERMERLDASGYADFCALGSISRDTLFESVCRLADAPSEENFEALRLDVALYISGINSVAAYTCFYK